MRAAVYTRYGPPEVVQIAEVERPAPADDEVLIRVEATTVCAADWRIRQADPFLVRLMIGLTRPRLRILGMELSGVVEQAGAAVTRFRPGDQVFALTGFRFGAHAQYACMPQDGVIAHKPAGMSFEEAAAVLFGAISALGFLRRAGVGPGQRVLVYGASGSVGVFAVQLARYLGATVTAVCSGGNLELVRSLGAEAVLDYARQDFSAAGRVYDVVLDAVGKAGVGRSLRALKRGGVYAQVSLIGPLAMLAALWAQLTGAARVVLGGPQPQPGDAELLKGLIDQGLIRTVIDRRYPLAEIAEAHRFAQAGHKRGHVVVQVRPQAANAGQG